MISCIRRHFGKIRSETEIIQQRASSRQYRWCLQPGCNWPSRPYIDFWSCQGTVGELGSLVRWHLHCPHHSWPPMRRVSPSFWGRGCNGFDEYSFSNSGLWSPCAPLYDARTHHSFEPWSPWFGRVICSFGVISYRRCAFASLPWGPPAPLAPCVLTSRLHQHNWPSSGQHFCCMSLREAVSCQWDSPQDHLLICGCRRPMTSANTYRLYASIYRPLFFYNLQYLCDL